MISKLKQKINSLMGTASGYKGIIFVNFCILVLVLGLMFVQYNWISKEKKALKSMIDKQTVKRKDKKNNIKTSKNLIKEPIHKKKQVDVSNVFSQVSNVFFQLNVLNKQGVIIL